MAEISFTVYGNPVALKRHRNFQRGNFRGVYDPSKGDKSDFLAKAMENRPEQPLDEPLEVELTFLFQRPKSHYRTGKNSDAMKDSAPLWHTGRPDIDNLVKFVADSLNGVYWRDDSCIAKIHAFKMYDVIPRTSITVRLLGGKGT